jgi:hypothetical protein
MTDVAEVALAPEDVERLGLAEALVLRPGDTLVLRVSGTGITQEWVEEAREYVEERLPGVELLVVHADGMTVYRPDGPDVA